MENDETEVSAETEAEIGNLWMYTVQQLMLMVKHQSQCVFFPIPFNPKNEYHTSKMHEFILTWNATTKTLSAPLGLTQEDFFNAMETCETDKFVVIPISLITSDSGHANILIYDKQDHSLERYEPNGVETPSKYFPEQLDEAIADFFLFYDYKVEYYPPEYFCPRKGLQYLEHYQSRPDFKYAINRGTCSLWTFVYADTRLSNPTKDRKEIHDIVIQNIKDKDKSMYAFIVKYLKTLKKVADELKNSDKSEESYEKILMENIK